MADKTINSFTNTALADTDSFIKQSAVGLTSKTTLGDIKDNFSSTFVSKGTVIWEDTPATSIYDLELKPNKIYAFYVEAFTGSPGYYQIVYAQALKNPAVRIYASFSYAYLDVSDNLQYSSGLIDCYYLFEDGIIYINSEHSIKVSKIIEYDEV